MIVSSLGISYRGSDSETKPGHCLLSPGVLKIGRSEQPQHFTRAQLPSDATVFLARNSTGSSWIQPTLLVFR